LLQRAGLGLAAISYDSTAVLQDFASRARVTIPLLSDHESKVIRRYGVNDRRYRAGSQLNVDSTGDVPVYGLACPAIFVINPDREVRWRFVSAREELRLTAASILHQAMGEFVAGPRKPLDAGRVQVATSATDSSAGLGTRVILNVELQIPAGLHVYGPGAPNDYHMLDWTMDKSNCLMIGEVKYPQPQWRRPAFANASLPEYEGTLRLSRELIITPMINAASPAGWEKFRRSCLDASSRFSAAGKLEFQACDDRQCFPPRSVPLEWSFTFRPPDHERVPVEDWRAFEH